MRRLLIICLAAALLLAPHSLSAEGFTEGFAKSAGGVVGHLMKERMIIYTISAAYYAKSNRWPSSTEELKKFLSEKDTGKGVNDKDIQYIKNSLDLGNLSFSPINDRKVLIEGRFDPELEKSLEQTGLGKCRLSVIAEKRNGNFIFTPSEKANDRKIYFSIPFTMKAKEEDG